jgi:hypothetical protein
VEDDRIVLDMRTIDPATIDDVVASLLHAFRAVRPR